MKILVVGGTGMIGGHAALHLQAKGHEVAIAGRNPPVASTPLGELEFKRLDYIEDAAPTGFEALVFAAGNDIRHLPQGQNAGAHWQRANSEAVPRFFASARAAGFRHAVQIGSFYPQAMPALVETNPYVRSRKLADDGARALNGAGFRVVSVNAPFVLGHVPGLVVGMFKAYTDYALGRMSPMPEFAPPGGVNFISTRSLSDAVEAALLHGTAGEAYLVGDENLSFADYFGAFFRAAGRAAPPVLDQEHPLLPDAAIYFGRGNSLFYEPDTRLAYRRNDVVPAIEEIVANNRGAA